MPEVGLTWGGFGKAKHDGKRTSRTRRPPGSHVFLPSQLHAQAATVRKKPMVTLWGPGMKLTGVPSQGSVLEQGQLLPELLFPALHYSWTIFIYS